MQTSQNNTIKLKTTQQKEQTKSLPITNDNNYDFEHEYIIDVPSKFEPTERGLGCLYFNKMKQHNDKVAQFIVETEEEDIYENLLQRCVRTALEMKSRNLTKSDVVVICSYNQKNNCVPFIASIFLGIPVASLDPTLSLMDTKYLLSEVRPSLLFVVSAALPLIEASLQDLDQECEIVVFEGSARYTDFSDFLQPYEEEESFLPEEITDLKETAVIFFSSGTTGLPKGIMLNHYSLMAQCHNMMDTGNFGMVLLSYASLYWISAVLLLNISISSGGARVICSKFNPVQLWNLIEKFQVETLFLPPTGAIAMVKVGRPDNLDTTSLTVCLIGGGSFAEAHVYKLRDLLPGTFIIQGYGQTEIAGIFTMFCANKVEDTLLLHYNVNSVGRVVPGVTAKVVEPDTNQLCGPFQNGELRVKSEYVMNGYYKRESTESFDEDGWLGSGDIVYYDKSYCFYVVDRIKEMLKYQSWHVPPAMIENVLTTHPAVQKSVVIGIPDDVDGDHPMAIVILNKNFDNKITANDLVDFVNCKVPDRMHLRAGLKFVDDIPLTPSGKIKRKEIREMVLRGDI